MILLTELLNKAKSASINTKAILITSIVVLSLIIVIILLYRSNQTAKNEVKIETVTKEKEVTQSEVKEWKDKINDHNQEYIETQKSSVTTIKDIRKNIKPTKLPNYEKPIIKDASYNAMLDSLLIAQPD